MNKKSLALVVSCFAIAVGNQFLIPLIYGEFFGYEPTAIFYCRAFAVVAWFLVAFLAYRYTRGQKGSIYLILASAPIMFWWKFVEWATFLAWSISGFGP